jgi:hypothetical protein
MRTLAPHCAAGSAPTWLKCPLPQRTFALELLEFVLTHRPQPFHSIPQFRSLLQSKVCGIVEALLRQGLAPGADSGDLAEVRLVLKAAGALVRKHAQLVPASASKLLQLLQQGCGAARAPWQRIASLQVVRSLVGDQLLLYQLFDMFDMSMEHDLNAVQVGGSAGHIGAGQWPEPAVALVQRQRRRGSGARSSRPAPTGTPCRSVGCVGLISSNGHAQQHSGPLRQGHRTAPHPTPTRPTTGGPCLPALPCTHARAQSPPQP